MARLGCRTNPRLLTAVLSTASTMVLVSACSGGNAPAPTESASPSSGDSGTSSATGSASPSAQPGFDEAMAKAGSAAPTEATGPSATGTPGLQKGAWTFQVASLRRASGRLFLAFTVKSANGQKLDVMEAYGFAPQGATDWEHSDIRFLKLQDPSTQKFSQPYLYKQGSISYCLCTRVQTPLGARPVPMYAELPDVVGSPSTVDLIIPGVPTIRGIQVQNG